MLPNRITPIQISADESTSQTTLSSSGGGIVTTDRTRELLAMSLALRDVSLRARQFAEATREAAARLRAR